MRVRSHQNPFAVNQDFSLTSLGEIFPKPKNPIYLEIGFAGGMFLLDFCANNPNINLYGLEIRKQLVDRVKIRIAENKLTNAYVEQANANTSITQLFAENSIDQVLIFFPDPWIKKKHIKRRLVNNQLVRDIATVLKPSGEVLIQSDVEELANDIRDHFETNNKFVNIHGANQWAKKNHLVSITERESYCIEDKTPIYRLKYSLIN
jgi:tRNA (guanine-N7-)-methyltransferase